MLTHVITAVLQRAIQCQVNLQSSLNHNETCTMCKYAGMPFFAKKYMKFVLLTLTLFYLIIVILPQHVLFVLYLSQVQYFYHFSQVHL